MIIGASYFGNRILRHVAADMEDLAARGFTGVLHTFSENDLAHYRDQMRSIVAASQAVGLDVMIDPWGVCHLFGGEAESRFVGMNPHLGQMLDNGRRAPAACPNQPAVRAFMRTWADAAIETGADRVFWDEPHWVRPHHFKRPARHWACRCGVCRALFEDRFGEPMPKQVTPDVIAFREASLVSFVGDLVAHCKGQGVRTVVCLEPFDGLDGLSDWSQVAALPGLDTLATDPYWKAFGKPCEPYVGEWATRLRALADAHGITPQLWIQGYGLGLADEDDIRSAVALAVDAGIQDLWTWGYDACTHMSGIAGTSGDQVWEIISDALTRAPLTAGSDT